MGWIMCYLTYLEEYLHIHYFKYVHSMQQQIPWPSQKHGFMRQYKYTSHRASAIPQGKYRQ